MIKIQRKSKPTGGSILNVMKTAYKDINLGALVAFYVIAISMRLITLVIGNNYTALCENYAFQLSTGLGPAIGALVAMAVFKRKTEYTIVGKSVWKTIVTIAVPCLVFAYGIIGLYYHISKVLPDPVLKLFELLSTKIKTIYVALWALIPLGPAFAKFFMKDLVFGELATTVIALGGLCVAVLIAVLGKNRKRRSQRRSRRHRR